MCFVVLNKTLVGSFKRLTFAVLPLIEALEFGAPIADKAFESDAIEYSTF